jgi:hypothetical protein
MGADSHSATITCGLRNGLRYLPARNQPNKSLSTKWR